MLTSLLLMRRQYALLICALFLVSSIWLVVYKAATVEKNKEETVLHIDKRDLGSLLASFSLATNVSENDLKFMLGAIFKDASVKIEKMESPSTFATTTAQTRKDAVSMVSADVKRESLNNYETTTEEKTQQPTLYHEKTQVNITLPNEIPKFNGNTQSTPQIQKSITSPATTTATEGLLLQQNVLDRLQSFTTTENPAKPSISMVNVKSLVKNTAVPNKSTSRPKLLVVLTSTHLADIKKFKSTRNASQLATTTTMNGWDSTFSGPEHTPTSSVTTEITNKLFRAPTTDKPSVEPKDLSRPTDKAETTVSKEATTPRRNRVQLSTLKHDPNMVPVFENQGVSNIFAISVKARDVLILSAFLLVAVGITAVLSSLLLKRRSTVNRSRNEAVEPYTVVRNTYLSLYSGW